MADELPEGLDAEYYPDRVPFEDDAELSKLFCFINEVRVCGPDCMAYTTHPVRSKAGSSALSPEQGHCVLLLEADRIGRNSTVLTKTVIDATKAIKLQRQDAQRDANTPKPAGPFSAPINPFPRDK